MMSDAGGESSGRGRAQRLPRWTRQEILVLIEGKRVVERTGRGRGRRGCSRGGGGEKGIDGGTEACEPSKWAAVAAYCRRHGVDRGPVQCRKRWSNLAGDYKKIREWEEQPRCDTSSSSFWAMRSDARKERRLPGFFDREVYDVLVDGRAAGNNAAPPLQRVDLVEGNNNEEMREKPTAAVVVLDSGGARGDMTTSALFSSSTEEEDGDDDNDEAAATTPPPPVPTPMLAPPTVATPVSAATSKRKELNEVTQDSPVHGRHKRQRSGEDASGRVTTDVQGQLIHILDRSGRMLAAQLEAQNINSRLDREQRKDQASSLLGVIGKMADALYRIADKL
ncbi:hypothetical protein PR202_gb15831 [Eleusine coracana subsp. coracana]|uniref:Myb-like domain-containing protein n=1 Tax=Eleusine coracana subsp. coracana TaxID=191504 RepID=A0AAV5F057_ELECO|nr:hypothetical protein PR202_gb15831 [Eleusine coracana subsp. coracana]